MKYLLIAIIISICTYSTSSQATPKQHTRYHICVRVAKPLPAFITNNLAAIQTSITKIKNVSSKINEGLGNEENTDSFSIDNNAVYLEVKATFAVPYPVPQTFLDEQATFENFLTKLRGNAMPSTFADEYVLEVSRHVCNNGLEPPVPCVIEENF